MIGGGGLVYIWGVNVIMGKSRVPIKNWSTLMWHHHTEESAEIVVIRLGIKRQHL